MKILVVDSTTEGQALYANKIQAFPEADLDALNIQQKLCSEKNCLNLAQHADVVIIGSQLAAHAGAVCSSIRALKSDVYFIMFVENEQYSEELIHYARRIGIDRVFPDWVPQIDFLQELLAVDSLLRKHGKSPLAKIVAFTSPKGGAGTTTAVAALADAAGLSGRRVLLWDLDSETRDLSRSLSAPLHKSQIIDRWMLGEESLTKDSFNLAMAKVDRTVDLLTPPLNEAAVDELLSGRSGIPFVKRIIQLARCMYDSVLIDLGGLQGPTAKALYPLVDSLVVLTGECALGVSSVDFFLSKLNAQLGCLHQVKILPSGSRFSIDELRSTLDFAAHLPSSAWDLPPLPADSRGASWPASGLTLYGLGSKESKHALDELAAKLGITNALPPAVIQRSSPVETFAHRVAAKVHGISLHPRLP